MKITVSFVAWPVAGCEGVPLGFGRTTILIRIGRGYLRANSTRQERLLAMIRRSAGNNQLRSGAPPARVLAFRSTRRLSSFASGVRQDLPRESQRAQADSRELLKMLQAFSLWRFYATI
jgi:hypothetical protein